MAILLFQILISLITGFGGGIWQKKKMSIIWYLNKEYSPAVEGTISFFSYLVLLNTMIPISLIVSLEIVKLV